MASKGDMEEVVVSMSKASIEVNEEVEKKIDRHCAFCLTLVPGAEVKLCSKCKKRAYCSKECQAADWTLSKDGPAFNGKIRGYGQGHKHWCGVPYGEEDLDFKVTPISGKGLGLIALRDFPPNYRIIIEGMQILRKVSASAFNLGLYPLHPGVDDLVLLHQGQGQGSDIYEKFNANSVTTSFGAGVVGLRISRANHSCDANASYEDDKTFRILTLYSIREIKAGEEICYAYKPFNDVFKILEDGFCGRDPESVRAILSQKWGIVCPPSCPCREEEKVELLKTCIKLDEECKKDFREKNVLPLMEKILDIAENKLGCSSSVMSNLLQRACNYAKAREETLSQAWSFKLQAFEQDIYYHEDDESC